MHAIVMSLPVPSGFVRYTDESFREACAEIGVVRARSMPRRQRLTYAALMRGGTSAVW